MTDEYWMNQVTEGILPRDLRLRVGPALGSGCAFQDVWASQVSMMARDGLAEALGSSLLLL